MRRILPLIFSIGALLVLFRFFVPNFLGAQNLVDIAEQISVNAILAFGMTAVILIGGIDLSVGALVALVGTVIAYTISICHWSTVPAVGLGVLAGVAFGVLNGTLAATTAIPPFIITLGTMLISRGCALRFHDGNPMSLPNSEKFLLALGNQRLGDYLPYPAMIMLGVYAIMALLMHFTIFGRHLYAIGNSHLAALYSGIRVGRCKIIAYALAALLTSVAGIVQCSQLLGGQPTSGQGFELDAIAAAVVGGASFTGGRGTMTGTLLGAIIIGILNKGLNQAGVHYSYQSIIKGAVILCAVWVDTYRKGHRE